MASTASIAKSKVRAKYLYDRRHSNVKVLRNVMREFELLYNLSLNLSEEEKDLILQQIQNIFQKLQSA